jgi:hypothetical protein
MTQVKDWIPAGLAIIAVLITAAYAVVKQTHAAEGIRDAGNLSAVITEASALAQRTVLTAAEIAELEARRSDLEQRRQDAGKPGFIVAELTEAARNGGLLVQGIQPIAEQEKGSQDSPRCPQYRIRVQGAYGPIAEYMDRCKQQRIPVRVREFRLGRAAGSEAAAPGALVADIVVEAFQPGASGRR